MVFEANQAEITYEIADDQVFIMHLVSGIYYVLEGTAVPIWRALISGASTEQISTLLIQHYPVDGARTAQTVQEFVHDLQRQGLILPTEGNPERVLTLEDLSPKFAAPRLQIYDDAQGFVGIEQITATSRLAPANQYVESEVFHDEALVLDLGRGIYFTLPGPARIIWDGISCQATVSEIVDLVRQFYSGERAVIEESVIAFARELQQEFLVGTEGGNFPRTKSALEAPPVQPLPYTSPEFQKFTDIQNLLLLDPIHDVETEAGWPAAANDRSLL